MIHPPDVWRDVTARIRFFTKETASQIPEESGLYAWFLPLWLFDDDLEALLAIVHSITNYDSKQLSAPVAKGTLELNWSSLRVQVEPDEQATPTEGLQDSWGAAIANVETRQALQVSLMEASILLPPLYIGKADDLKTRYQQHVDGSEGKNDFHSRFSKRAKEIDLPLLVHDLLFVCLSTSPAAYAMERETDGLNRLVEQVVMRMSRPPYSNR